MENDEIEWYKKIVMPWMKEHWWFGGGMTVVLIIQIIGGSTGF